MNINTRFTTNCYSVFVKLVLPDKAAIPIWILSILLWSNVLNLRINLYRELIVQLEKIFYFLYVYVISEENAEGTDKKKKLVMEHQIAAFHVAISQTKQERVNIFNKVGPYRRALCARRDLHIRNLLCKPVNKVLLHS